MWLVLLMGEKAVDRAESPRRYRRFMVDRAWMWSAQEYPERIPGRKFQRTCYENVIAWLLYMQLSICCFVR